MVGGQPVEGSQRAEGTPSLLALNAAVHGQVVVLRTIRFRNGRRHVVVLTLRWQPTWGEWLLARYDERPE